MKPVHLNLSVTDRKLELGESRFWGNPDLPEGTPYPCFPDSSGELYPYTFICQINLDHLSAVCPGNPLPSKGLLSFFAKIDNYLGYPVNDNGIGGCICDADDVRIFYFPSLDNLMELIPVDDDGEPLNPHEMKIAFSYDPGPEGDEHELFARPTHREWESWDEPFEDWSILLQIDSFSGYDFDLNFMDCGVLDFLISPEALQSHDFSNVRALVLST